MCRHEMKFGLKRAPDSIRRLPVVSFILLIGMIVMAGPAVAQKKSGEQPWAIFSPRPGDTVKNREVFIVAQFKSDYEISEKAVQVFIDNRYITQNVKVSDNKVSLLYMVPMEPGKHTVEIRAKLRGYRWLAPLKWDFYVDVPSKKELQSDTSVYKRYALVGTFWGEHRITQLSGPGSEFRQEPPFTTLLNLQGEGRIKNVRFPFKVMGTSDEYNYYPGLMPRNHIQGGIETNSLSLMGGDVNPTFDPLVLTGIRVRGGEFKLTRKRFAVDIVHGYAIQPLEGIRALYVKDQGPPPGKLDEDSTYIIPGTYRRDITAMRIAFGNKNEESVTGFNFMRGRDDTSSIQHGQYPKDNYVFGIDQIVAGSDNRFQVRAGIAMSFFTNNTAKGALTKTQLDSMFDYDFPFDPYKLRHLIVLNETTTQPHKSALSGFITLTSNLKWQTMTLEYRYIGSDYQSFGNPFSRVDTRSGRINEQLRFFKNKLIFNGSYRLEHNNLLKHLLATTYSQFYNGTMIYTPGAKMPRISFTYAGQLRTAKSDIPAFGNINDRQTSINATLFYDIVTWKLKHTISGNITEVLRTNELRPESGTDIIILNASFAETIIPIKLRLEARYFMMYYVSATADPITLAENIQGSLQYDLPIRGFTLKALYSTTLNSHSAYTSRASRNRYSASLRAKLGAAAYLELESGYNPFRHQFSEIYDFDEWYVSTRLQYDFNWTKR